jgi:hypothetical protein
MLDTPRKFLPYATIEPDLHSEQALCPPLPSRRTCRPTEQTMAGPDQEKLDRQFERIQQKLPRPVSRFLRWLRKPSSRWVRIPVGILLIIGGILSFLPILGLWMLPLGLLLLAQDLPFLQRPMRRLLVRASHRWMRWKRSRGHRTPRRNP